MKRLALVCLGVIGLSVAAAAAGEAGLAKYVPGNAAPKGWKSDGATRVFIGEELYDYIDGGAEIFMEYGFLAAATQDYIGPGGRRLVLEIYEMEDDTAAYGIFTAFRTPAGEAIALGDAGQLTDYYLSFWKGRFLVNVTLGGGAEDSSTVLRALAGAVGERLPGQGRIPRLAGLLPAEGRLPSGVDYFEGSLGFLNSSGFFGGDVFGVRRGVKAPYSGGYDVLILEFDSPEESRERYSLAEKRLEGGRGIRGFSSEGPRRFRFRKEDGRSAVVALVGPYILAGVIERPGPESEAALAASLEEVEGSHRASGPWRAGFEERVRYVTWDNVRTLDKERYLGQAAVLLRTRLSLSRRFAAGLEFELGLTNELHQMIVPSGEAFQWDEVIFDTLCIRWTRPAGLPLTLTLGRQGAFFGEGFLVAEGTPLDETRSDYFNAVRLDWTPAGGRQVTLFACHQTETDTFLPVLHGMNRSLVEQPETGLGLVWSWKGETREWEASLIYKNAAAGSASLKEADILTLGGRSAWKPFPEVSLSGEAAFQAGELGGAGLTTWGANVRLTWDARNLLRLPLRVLVGGLYLSGDDPSTGKTEGWEPLFSRWPRWSESYIYTLAEENQGRMSWWSNLSSVFGELDIRLSQKLGLRLAAHRLAAPQAASGSWSRISGLGHVRGNLFSARLEFVLSGRLKGHLLYESFRPGSFYVPSADGYSFLRFELLWGF